MLTSTWCKFACVLLICAVASSKPTGRFLQTRKQAIGERFTTSAHTVRIALRRLPEFGKLNSWLGSSTDSWLRSSRIGAELSPYRVSPGHVVGSAISLGSSIATVGKENAAGIAHTNQGGVLHEELKPARHVYVGTLTFGGDAQPVQMLFDTGSGNLVIPTAQSAAEPVAPAKLPKAWKGPPPPPIHHHGFNPESGGAKPIADKSDPAEISYASGSLSGKEVEARACLGSTCAEHMRLLLADYVSEDLRQFEFDGVLGLSLPGLGLDGNSSNFLDAMVSSGALPAPVFAISLGTGGGEEPEVIFGGYDVQKVAAGEEMRWLSICEPEEGQWQVPLVGMGARGHGSATSKRLNVCNSEDRCRAVLDTGSAQLTAPKDIVDALHQALSPVNCQDTSAMPTLSLFLGDAGAFNLDASDYLEFSTIDPSVCRLAVGVHENNQRDILLGHPFLQRYYAVFDQAEPRIGLARAANSAS